MPPAQNHPPPAGSDFAARGLGSGCRMNVVVIGATGNVGTALLRALDANDEVGSVLGVARRIPAAPDTRGASSKVTWRAADVSADPLDFLPRADAVVHLAWLIQPSRDEAMMRATNVDGTRRLVDEVVRQGVPA